MKVDNFLKHYIFHPSCNRLTRHEQKLAWFSTITLLFLTFGFFHLFCAVYQSLSGRVKEEPRLLPIERVRQTAERAISPPKREESFLPNIEDHREMIAACSDRAEDYIVQLQQAVTRGSLTQAELNQLLSELPRLMDHGPTV